MIRTYSTSDRVLQTPAQIMQFHHRLSPNAPYHLPRLPQPLLVIRQRDEILERRHGPPSRKNAA